MVLKFEGGSWWACVSFKHEAPAAVVGRSLGIDLGLKNEARQLRRSMRGIPRIDALTAVRLRNRTAEAVGIDVVTVRITITPISTLLST